MSTDLVAASSAAGPATLAGIYAPANLGEAHKLAGALVRSGMLPRGIQSPEAALAIMIAGAEVGLPAMTALRTFHIVEGRPTMSADLMVALVKKSAACGYFQLVESTAERAVYETKRNGDAAPTRMAFTLDEARAAGLAGKGTWQKHPAAMLRARCAAALCRAVYPDIVLGIYDPSELEQREAPAIEMQAVKASAPEAQDAEIVDADEELGVDVFRAFATAYEECGRDEWQAITAAVKSARLTDAQRADLREFAKRARARIKAEETTTTGREPGEEG